MPEAPAYSGCPRALCCIINWNGLLDTVECLESVLKIDYPDYDILVIDNGSARNEADEIQRQFGTRVFTIRSPRNEGFAGGANRGIRFAKEQGYAYILLLNNDCTVASDLLSELERAFTTGGNVAMAGPAVCYYDRREVVSSAGVIFDRCMAKGRRRGVERLLSELPKAPYDVDVIDGSCMLVSIAAIEEVGSLDPVYFVYWEETDWCVRFRQRGFRVVCSPATRIWHKRWKSVGGFSGELYFYAYLRNQLLFMRRNSHGFCTLPQSLAYARLAITSLSVGVWHRRVEGPKVIVRMLWLILHALAWNLHDSIEDFTLAALVDLRERTLIRAV